VSDQEGGDEEKEWREQQHAFRRTARRVRPPRGTSYSPTPSPHRVTYPNPRRSTSPRRPKTLPNKKAASRRPRHTPSPPRPPTPPLDDQASRDGHADETDAETPAQKEEEEEPAPQPLPRALRRRPSMTMPGALFPRSPSMDPESAPASQPPQRHVHFPTRPTYFDYEVPMSGPSSSPEHARHPSPSPVPIPSRSRAASVSEVSTRRCTGGFSWQGCVEGEGEAARDGRVGERNGTVAREVDFEWERSRRRERRGTRS
jgi:hypothetical protein